MGRVGVRLRRSLEAAARGRRAARGLELMGASGRRGSVSLGYRGLRPGEGGRQGRGGAAGVGGHWEGSASCEGRWRGGDRLLLSLSFNTDEVLHGWILVTPVHPVSYKA